MVGEGNASGPKYNKEQVNYEEEIHRLNDMQERSMRILRIHTEILATQAQGMVAFERTLADFKHALDEAVDKLNGLIGYISHMRPEPQP